MSFFSNVKIIAKSTSRALGDSVELLASAAEEIEKVANATNLKQKFRSLESEIDRLDPLVTSKDEVRKLHLKLMGAYQNAIAGSSSEDKIIIKKKKLLLKEKMQDEDVESLKEVINMKLLSLEQSDDRLPVDKIVRLKDLRSDYKKLLLLSQGFKKASKNSILSIRITDINKEIEKLEEKRATREVAAGISGNTLSVINKHDGVRHGVSTFWYENGNKWKEINYWKGDPDGISRLWSSEGDLICSIFFSKSERKILQQVYLCSGEKICEFDYQERGGVAKFWQKNGAVIASVNCYSNKLSRTSLFFNMIFRPSVWFLIYRTLRKEEEKAVYNEMQAALEKFCSFSDEVLKNYLVPVEVV